MTVPGLVIAAPASGSGKTTLTLALIRALTARGLRIATAKVGPDYIDLAFHAAAGGRACVNLDTWAMPPVLLSGLTEQLGRDADVIVTEGVMGLLDGAGGPGQPGYDPMTDGSTGALAAATGWPVVLVVDARGMAATAGAVVRGLAGARPDVTVVGVIFTRCGRGAHAQTLHAATVALAPEVAMLGALPRDSDLVLPSRHLGLVQAAEHPDLAGFLDHAGACAARHIDLEALMARARPARSSGAATSPPPCPLPPPGARIAVAQDLAFAFSYAAVLDGWRAAGAEVRPFSPLADEVPDPDADAIYLPGGYPELHAGRLAANRRFLDGLRRAAACGVAVFGECGGYMVLGDGLEDADGTRHAMAGLLPLETSMRGSRLTLGYRRLTTLAGGPFGLAGRVFGGHEFHHARVVREGEAPALFQVTDARGRDLGTAGRRVGTVAGSFQHLIAERP